MTADSAWDPALDALVAAPAHHRLLLENAHVRVLDTRILPGETVPVHLHRWPATHYVLGISHFVRRDAAGTVLVDSRALPRLPEPGTTFWGDALGPHTLENVGSTPIHVVSTELKAVGARA